MIDLVFGDVLTNPLSGAVAALVGFTGLFSAAAYYAAVLAGRLEREVERATGIGFFIGFAIGVLVLVADALT